MKLYTIGHSNDPIDYFFSLLRQNGIDTVADVRSIPYSRYARQFNKNALETFLEKRSLRYLYMGDTLGGKIRDPAYLDGKGRIDTAKVVKSPKFLAGISRLEREIAGGAVLALLCAEKEPLRCHRFFLISRFLTARGYEVLHIVGGEVFSHAALEETVRKRSTGRQLNLFDSD